MVAFASELIAIDTTNLGDLDQPGAEQPAAEYVAAKARADALAENQDAVIGQQLAEQWPAIVEAAAKPFGSVDQMIVLNGAQGLSEALASALSSGVAGLQMARSVLGQGSGNGSGNSKGHKEVPPSQSS